MARLASIIYARWGARLIFVPNKETHLEPTIEVREPEPGHGTLTTEKRGAVSWDSRKWINERPEDRAATPAPDRPGGCRRTLGPRPV